MIKQKILLFWSGGKNSALALYHLRKDPQFEVVGLVTVFDRSTNLVPFHGIPDSLVIDQAKMLKLPLQRIFLPSSPSNLEYCEAIRNVLGKFKKIGIETIAFGDSQFEEIKLFRETLLAPIEMKALFPLWNKTSKTISTEFLETGHKALVTSVLTEKLDNTFLACEFNQNYLDRLPSTIDLAGSNGEFHTFVNYGPDFKMRVAFSKSMAHPEGPYLVSAVKEP